MSRRLREVLAHPFWQAALLLLAAYVIILVIGWISAPVPKTVVIQYLFTALVGVLVFVSDNEQRWTRFKEPIRRTMVEPERRGLRTSLLVALPVLVGWMTYQQVRPSVSAPAALRSVHPASPVRITFRGQQMDLATLENPLRQTGDLQEHYAAGKRVYYQNCLPCHGDLLDGRGHFAHGFNPTPLPFDGSTIAQLRESFVFWRIAKGGPGLPKEGAPWNSAMPVWEDFLTEEEIWQVIIFLYEQTGLQPRRLGAGGEGEAHE
ncbi:MAG TPA: cytochrome c [Gemmatimonadales bacterium]|nr:cytochrome c [Gemmatimonadales bacterium]